MSEDHHILRMLLYFFFIQTSFCGVYQPIFSTNKSENITSFKTHQETIISCLSLNADSTSFKGETKKCQQKNDNYECITWEEAPCRAPAQHCTSLTDDVTGMTYSLSQQRCVRASYVMLPQQVVLPPVLLISITLPVHRAGVCTLYR